MLPNFLPSKKPIFWSRSQTHHEHDQHDMTRWSCSSIHRPAKLRPEIHTFMWKASFVHLGPGMIWNDVLDRFWSPDPNQIIKLSQFDPEHSRNRSFNHRHKTWIDQLDDLRHCPRFERSRIKLCWMSERSGWPSSTSKIMSWSCLDHVLIMWRWSNDDQMMIKQCFKQAFKKLRRTLSVWDGLWHELDDVWMMICLPLIDCLNCFSWWLLISLITLDCFTWWIACCNLHSKFLDC